MTATVHAVPHSAAAAVRTRPFFWSVQRELWENRAVYLTAPVAACVVVLGAALGHTVTNGAVIIQPNGPHPFHVPEALAYVFAAAAILLASCVAGGFYCLGALNGERRDRSVLFWKSLPVSDLTTVLSKAAIPALIMPAVTLVSICAAHLVMLAMDLGSAAAQGRSVAEVLNDLPLGQIWIDLGYSFVLLAAWWAPLWSWLLLVSAWSRRMTFLWAVAPPLAICVIEKMSLGTNYAWNMLQARLLNGIGAGFTTPPPSEPTALPWPDPLPFLAEPGLWIGLVLAAGFLAGAVWLRRRQEPI